MVAALRHDHLIVLNLLVEYDVTGDRILRVEALRDVLLSGLANRIGRFVEMHSGSAVAKRNDVEAQRTCTAQRACTAVKRGTSRENIVDEDILQRRINVRPWGKCKGIFQIRHSRATIKRGLRLRIDDRSEERRVGKECK